MKTCKFLKVGFNPGPGYNPTPNPVDITTIQIPKGMQDTNPMNLLPLPPPIKRPDEQIMPSMSRIPPPAADPSQTTPNSIYVRHNRDDSWYAWINNGREWIPYDIRNSHPSIPWQQVAPGIDQLFAPNIPPSVPIPPPQAPMPPPPAPTPQLDMSSFATITYVNDLITTQMQQVQQNVQNVMQRIQDVDSKCDQSTSQLRDLATKQVADSQKQKSTDAQMLSLAKNQTNAISQLQTLTQKQDELSFQVTKYTQSSSTQELSAADITIINKLIKEENNKFRKQVTDEIMTKTRGIALSTTLTPEMRLEIDKLIQEESKMLNDKNKIAITFRDQQIQNTITNEVTKQTQAIQDQIKKDIMTTLPTKNNASSNLTPEMLTEINMLIRNEQKTLEFVQESLKQLAPKIDAVISSNNKNIKTSSDDVKKILENIDKVRYPKYKMQYFFILIGYIEGLALEIKYWDKNIIRDKYEAFVKTQAPSQPTGLSPFEWKMYKRIFADTDNAFNIIFNSLYITPDMMKQNQASTPTTSLSKRAR